MAKTNPQVEGYRAQAARILDNMGQRQRAIIPLPNDGRDTAIIKAVGDVAYRRFGCGGYRTERRKDPPVLIVWKVWKDADEATKVSVSS